MPDVIVSRPPRAPWATPAVSTPRSHRYIHRVPAYDARLLQLRQLQQQVPGTSVIPVDVPWFHRAATLVLTDADLETAWPELATVMYLVDTPAASHLVELFLISGASNDWIADACGYAPAVIQLYHDLAFNIRGQLGLPWFLGPQLFGQTMLPMYVQPPSTWQGQGSPEVKQHRWLAMTWSDAPMCQRFHCGHLLPEDYVYLHRHVAQLAAGMLFDDLLSQAPDEDDTATEAMQKVSICRRISEAVEPRPVARRRKKTTGSTLPAGTDAEQFTTVQVMVQEFFPASWNSGTMTPDPHNSSDCSSLQRYERRSKSLSN